MLSGLSGHPGVTRGRPDWYACSGRPDSRRHGALQVVLYRRRCWAHGFGFGPATGKKKYAQKTKKKAVSVPENSLFVADRRSAPLPVSGAVGLASVKLQQRAGPQGVSAKGGLGLACC